MLAGNWFSAPAKRDASQDSLLPPLRPFETLLEIEHLLQEFTVRILQASRPKHHSSGSLVNQRQDVVLERFGG